MKKVLSLFMVLLLAISLFACGNKENKEPTVPTPATPEQVTPITPPETSVLPPETPVIPPETPTPDVPDTHIRNPEEVLQQLLITSRDHIFHSQYQFEGVSFLSVEDAEAVIEGKKEVTDGWHVINAGGHILVKSDTGILPSFASPSDYTTRTVWGELYIDVPPSEFSSPRPNYYYRVLEDGRSLEYYLSYFVSDIERYVIYDTVAQIFD